MSYESRGPRCGVGSLVVRTEACRRSPGRLQSPAPAVGTLAADPVDRVEGSPKALLSRRPSCWAAEGGLVARQVGGGWLVWPPRPASPRPHCTATSPPAGRQHPPPSGNESGWSAPVPTIQIAATSRGSPKRTAAQCSALPPSSGSVRPKAWACRPATYSLVALCRAASRRLSGPHGRPAAISAISTSSTRFGCTSTAWSGVHGLT